MKMNTKVITTALAIFVIGLFTSYALAEPLADRSNDTAVNSTVKAKPLGCGGGGCTQKSEAEKVEEKKSCGQDCKKACCQKDANAEKSKSGCDKSKGSCSKTKTP